LLLALVVAAGCSSSSEHETSGSTGGEPDAGVKPSPDCPQAGGSMVQIADAQGGVFCMDQNLVTNRAYAEWLDTNPSQDLRPAVCRPSSGFCDGCVDSGRNSVFFSFAPHDYGEPVVYEGPILLGFKCPDKPACAQGDESCEGFPDWPVAPSQLDYPVVNVTWCDARVYCGAHGKRLCGAIGGGPLPIEKPHVFSGHATDYSAVRKLDHVVRDPHISEYANAFTAGGQRRLPYGDAFDPGACPSSPYCAVWPSPSENAAMGAIHAVQSIPGCAGADPGVFDLIGNAAEFLDACDVDPDSAAVPNDVYPGCVVAGGFDAHGQVDGWIYFSNPDSSVGFRCCADVAKH
jgi:formylglycine-generating enzyme required for sulfatase activity